jgi:hypothetical protein
MERRLVFRPQEMFMITKNDRKTLKRLDHFCLYLCTLDCCPFAYDGYGGIGYGEVDDDVKQLWRLLRRFARCLGPHCESVVQRYIEADFKTQRRVDAQADVWSHDPRSEPGDIPAMQAAIMAGAVRRPRTVEGSEQGSRPLYEGEPERGQADGEGYTEAPPS